MVSPLMPKKRYTREARSEIDTSEYNLYRKIAITPIMFNKYDEVNYLYEDPLVLTLGVGPCEIFCILVDTRCSINLLLFSKFHALGLCDEEIEKK